MSNRIYSNDIKGVRTENSEGLVYGRGHMFEQADLGCLADNVSPEQNNQNTTTTRKGKNRKYSKEENMLIMECYLYSNPSRLGYRKRMLELWNSKSLFFITKQWLFHQANNVHKRGWLIEIELEERERKNWSLIMTTGTILTLIMLLTKRQTLVPCLKKNRLLNK